MEKKNVINALKHVRETSSKRKFKQTFDVIINTKDLDLKKTEQQVDVFATLHYPKGKAVKVCGLVGPELSEQSKSNFERTILTDQFESFARDKKATKKLATEFDFFVAQANIMAQIAGAFGKVLGSRGKMPNPKVGCVVPPNANLRLLSEKLHKIVRLKAKTTPVVQAAVGSEEMKDEEIAENIVDIYNNLLNALPSHEHNMGKIFLKLTMGKPVELDIHGNVVVKKEQGTESKKKVKEEKKAEVKEAKKEQPKETKKK